MGESYEFGMEIDESLREVRVEGYVSHDQEVVKYFASVDEDQRAVQFETAVKLGVVALKMMGTAQNVDYVEKCFEAMLKDFASKLDEALGDKGTVRQLVDQYFGERGMVTEMVEDTFGEDGAFSKHLTDMFGPDGTIVKDVFDPSKEGTPLAELKNEMIRQFTELRKDFAAARREREIVSKTPRKGKEFEDSFEDMLGRLTEPHGDKVERTGDKPGLLAPSKKGDFVVTLCNNPDLKIALEVKDTGEMTFPAMEKELMEAMENRGASYGVFVAKSISTLPSGVGWFNEYNGNMLAFALGENDESELAEEVLKIGYKWARLRLLSGEGRELEGIDSRLLHEKIHEASRRLKELSSVKTTCTKAMDNIQAIRDSVEEVMSSLKTILEEILEEIDRVTGQGE